MSKAVYFLLTLAISLQLSLSAEPAPPSSIYDISVKSLDGQSIPFSAFRGRVLLIVNTASTDRNAAQMEQLEALYQRFKEPGFAVLAFPSNDFNTEVEATGNELRAAYKQKFDATFPIFEKVHVTGSNISPLYAYLTSYSTDPSFSWQVDWNFTKFLVDRSGKIINRFGTNILPNDPKVAAAIEKALGTLPSQ